MSQLLQALVDPSLGVVSVANDTAAPEGFSGGIPVDGKSVAVDTVSPITGYHMGIPITSNSRISVVIDGVIDSYGGGAAPIDSTGRLVISSTAGTLSYLAVPFSDGRVLTN